jgi:macrophage erythroblast attacher
MQSKLEFLLRLQEFIEMVKANDYLRAIAYARKYLAPWGGTYTKELQHVTATLAFKSGTHCSAYKVRSSSTLFKFCYYFVLGWDLLRMDISTISPILAIWLSS